MMIEQNEDLTESSIPDGADEGELQLSSATRSVSPDKNDRSLTELHRWFQKGRLIIDPEWQREFVWDYKRGSRLIESFLIDLPVPVVYLAANSMGSFEVIDGLQRLTSIFHFFDGTYKLSGLEIRSDLNGKSFKTLDLKLQTKLEDCTLRTFELPSTTDKDLMFLIFERLNTGGIALNDMEIRNCLYRGKLNDTLKTLVADENFVLAVNQKNLGKRMLDRTLILRFLAFYQLTYVKARKGLKSFINEFFETYRNPSQAKLDEFEEQFSKAMRASTTIFGRSGFRLRVTREGSKGSEWTPRVNAAVFQIVAVSFASYDIGSLTRAADSIYEEYLDLLATDPQWSDSVTKSTGDFARIEYAFEAWNGRLKKLMKSFPPNDVRRAFTRALKNELWEQNRTCALCKNEITTINDAAVDHIEHYWRGGKTIPDNARLTHRLCNSARPD
jgi:hypothetical protein